MADADVNYNKKNSYQMGEGPEFQGLRGSLTKRSIAERRGFSSDAARINTPRFRTASQLASPAARSPRVTLPPGISPTALLDSAIMLPNSQALPSPTTGTFLLPPLSHQGSILTSVPLDAGTGLASSSKFKPEANYNPLPASSILEIQVSDHCIIAKGGISDCQPPVPDQALLDFAIPAEFPKGHKIKSELHSYDDVRMVQDAIYNANNVEMQMHRSEEATDKSFPPNKANRDIGLQNLMEEGKRETSYLMGMVRTSEDGYNWRKYGQKQVKGSEYPRSYYKCTHPNCQVKKKVERSLDGQITEIIYKGTHNHGKPQPSRRPSLGSALSTDEMLEMGEGGGTFVKVDGGWRNMHSGMKDIKQNSDWKADNQERTPSTSVVTELSDLVSTNKGKPISMFESEDTLELSSTLASQDDDEDGATQGSISLEEDADEELESKRRKKEICLIDSNFGSRAVREPRVVVQIESELDILDDGYRWRKYGQKVVKGNPNPRSYYKCTSAGCLVRKHVERASHDLKFIITTYVGKHNHEVPTARSNNQMNSSGAAILPSAANAQAALALPGNVSIPKPESQVPNTAPHFERKPEFSNELPKPDLIGFSDAMNFGSSSLCQMKYTPFSNTLPYGSYEMNSGRRATAQPGSMTSVFADFPMSLPLNLPSSGSFLPAGLNLNCVRPMGPIQPFLSGQQLKEVDTGFLGSKQEHKDTLIYDTCIPIVDDASPSLTPSLASTSVYHRAVHNFPS
ncbi:WRKY transcription factor SUSIBA2-like [Prosopis cineraria]|uniref:WRKY transcription factor SUSIBA2-like n=1 Tax=Prosopis cineraria TaxID=364024 RepID=UPI0024104382|nr:WRKY transcription factor SUSIBA2-like [Prosopis cineraria]